MAAAKKKAASKKVAVRADNTSIATIEKQLAQERERQGSVLGSSGGSSAKINDQGLIALPDGTTTDVVAGVIIDWAAVRTWYDSPLGSNEPPACWAISEAASLSPGGGTEGRAHDLLEADKSISDPVHDGLCGQCPLNEFGTADNGKSKACNERYRLAVGDSTNPQAPLIIFNLQVSAKAGFEALVNNLSKRYGKSPIQFIVHIGVGMKGTVRFFTFEIGDDNPNLAGHWERRTEAQSQVTQAFQAKIEAPQPRGRTTKKKAGRTRR